MFLIQEEKASSTELGFLKYTIYIRVVRLSDLFDLSQIEDRQALFEILIVIHSDGTSDFYPGIVLEGLVTSCRRQSVNTWIGDTVDNPKTEMLNPTECLKNQALS